MEGHPTERKRRGGLRRKTGDFIPLIPPSKLIPLIQDGQNEPFA